jgi:hypothetical protein
MVRVVTTIFQDNFAPNKQKYFPKTIQITSRNFILQFAYTRLRAYTGYFKSTFTTLKVVAAQVTPDMIRRSCKTTGYGCDICRATTGSNIEL